MSGGWDELLPAAGRVMYVCRRYDPERHLRVMVMNCADCGESVAVTPTVLADRRGKASAAGRDLDVVCDSCAVTFAEDSQADVIAVMPTAEESRGV